MRPLRDGRVVIVLVVSMGTILMSCSSGTDLIRGQDSILSQSKRNEAAIKQLSEDAATSRKFMIETTGYTMQYLGTLNKTLEAIERDLASSRMCTPRILPPLHEDGYGGAK